MENGQGANRFIIEPPAVDAAITAIRFRAGALRPGEEQVAGGSALAAEAVAVLERPAVCDGDNAAAADALIRVEEAAAAEAARNTEQARVAAAESVAPVVVAAAGSPGVEVHASDAASLGSSPEVECNGGRVRTAVRTLESSVTAETVGVRYGQHDARRGRQFEREIEERRRRRARSASCVDDVVAGPSRSGGGDRRRGYHVDTAYTSTPAPVHTSQRPIPERREDYSSYGYLPQFCPPPSFPAEVLEMPYAGGEGRSGGSRRRRRSRERARVDERSVRPTDPRVRSRSPRRQ